MVHSKLSLVGEHQPGFRLTDVSKKKNDGLEITKFQKVK